MTVISRARYPVHVSIGYIQTNQVPNHQLRLLKSFFKEGGPSLSFSLPLPQVVVFTRSVYEPLYGQPTHNEQLTSSHQTPFEPNSRNRGEQPPPPPSQSSREAVPWGSSIFNLPYRVSSSTGPLEKRHFPFSTLKKIQSADGSYASKVGALASRFETGEILFREAHGHLAPMYYKASRTPIWNSTAYQITNPILMNEDRRHIVPNTTATASLSQLSTCAFLRFDLTIDPMTVYGACLQA